MAWGHAKGAKSPDFGPLGALLQICSFGAEGKGDASAPAARSVVRIIMVDCILDGSEGLSSKMSAWKYILNESANVVA